MQVLMPNYLPHSESFKKLPIYNQIINRLPIVDVVELEPETLGGNSLFANLGEFSFIQALKDITKPGGEDALEDIIKKAFPNIADNNSTQHGTMLNNNYTVNSFSDINAHAKIENPLPLAIKLFFRSFSSSAKARYIFPLTSSPNISIKTGTGWNDANLSLLTLITDYAKKMPDAVQDGRLSVLGSLGNLTEFIGTSLSFLGKDVQLGPYFKVTGVMDNYPEFSFTTQFLNDSQKSAENNKEIIRKLTIDSLPGATKDISFKPGSLFNVLVGTGIGHDDTSNSFTPMKQLYLCTADIKVKSVGIYRDKFTPELYEVDFTFKSLLPDYVNLQMLEFSSHGTNLIGKNTNTPKESPIMEDFSKPDNTPEQQSKLGDYTGNYQNNIPVKSGSLESLQAEASSW